MPHNASTLPLWQAVAFDFITCRTAVRALADQAPGCGGCKNGQRALWTMKSGSKAADNYRCIMSDLPGL
jgi:hypothetical protein